MPEHARIQVKARVLRGGLERARIHETHGLVRLQRLVGNHAVQRLLAQRDYEPTKAEERDFTDLVPQKWGSGVTADGAKKLAAGWCRSHAQFLSLVNNFSWAEFVALTKKYKDGNLVPVKANDIRQKMQKEMQAELALIQQQKIERFRKECRGVKLTQAIADGWVTVAHHHTFRTDDEKKQKGGNPTGPFTRNFSAQVQNQAALWEVHVHYRDSKNQVVEKAHVKLITQRHSKDHVWDLPSNHAIVQAAGAVIAATVDSSLTDI